jgi:release factor glutamine methyltransferase
MDAQDRLSAARRVGDILNHASTLLREHGVGTARLDARLIIEAATGLTREALLRSPDHEPDAEARAAIATMIARRAGREPLSHILGVREFWSLPFQVTGDVLTPRPDSETVVEAVLELVGGRRGPLRLLDLGTGSGCLLLALLHEIGGATGVGVDRSAAALEIAAANSRALGLAGRAEFRHGDWGSGLTSRFDVVVSNPPYLARRELAGLEPEVARYEPRAALDGGDDGLDAYRRLLPDVKRLLADGGFAALEHGVGQAGAVAGLAAAVGLTAIGRRRDLGGIDRVLLVKS